MSVILEYDEQLRLKYIGRFLSFKITHKVIGRVTDIDPNYFIIDDGIHLKGRRVLIHRTVAQNCYDVCPRAYQPFFE